MQTYTSQDAASKTLSSRTKGSKTPSLAVIDAGTRTVDQRHEAGAMRQLQSRANHSPPALQLQSLQQMARQSPQAKRLHTLQAMADERSPTHAKPDQRCRRQRALNKNPPSK
ncbi:hypothetical protein ACO0K9_11810 [Undibacterium sp. Ji50W]|uniref:hypothetical protein n=1 Tax=Undibacterium sp. Ji50W TaxID=3413041 RepID=UPI003BF103AD